MKISFETCCVGKTCGLIAESDNQRFIKPAPEDEEVQLFDRLCDLSDNGFVSLHGRVVRVDHKIEGKNEIRSVLEYKGVDESGLEIWRVASVINHENGSTYLEVHEDRELGGQVVWEPVVGASEVIPGEHQDMLLHYRVAYEAAPLTTAA